MPRLDSHAIAPSVYTAVDNKLAAADVFVGCHGGKAHYWPELVLDRGTKNYSTRTVHVGDTIVQRLAYGHKGRSVSVVDETHKFKV